jgi:SRSO17 transposase
VAAGHSVELDPARWQELLEELLGRVAGRFARVDLRWRARAFVGGLLADLPCKNCWTIAEHASDPTPDGMQHLLARAVWDEDAVRDDLRDYLVEHLGDPQATLVVDETSDLKKGTHTVGVQRQYTGTAGRVENAQVAVYLGYATDDGHAVVDRELYLPRSWTDDPARCQAVGVPEQVGFATKPGAGADMMRRALDAGMPAAWVTGDEVYGANPALRRSLRLAGSGMCWRSPATTGFGSAAPATGSTPCSGGSRPGVAVCVGRSGRQRPPLLRLGVCALGPRRPAACGSGRAALAAGAPQPHHRRAGLLPLLHASSHPAGRPGQSRRPPPESRRYGRFSTSRP